MSYRENLGDAEKPIWDEAYALFEDLLTNLRTRNLLRRGTSRGDRERLMYIWQNSRNYGMAFNEMQAIFDNRETVEACSKNSGLSLGTLTYAFVAQLVGTALISFESVFKTSLLFFLKEEQGISRIMTLGQMLNIIESILPAIGNRLKTMIDTRIRNSLGRNFLVYGRWKSIFGIQ